MKTSAVGCAAQAASTLQNKSTEITPDKQERQALKLVTLYSEKVRRPLK